MFYQYRLLLDYHYALFEVLAQPNSGVGTRRTASDNGYVSVNDVVGIELQIVDFRDYGRQNGKGRKGRGERDGNHYCDHGNARGWNGSVGLAVRSQGWETRIPERQTLILLNFQPTGEEREWPNKLLSKISVALVPKSRILPGFSQYREGISRAPVHRQTAAADGDGG
jgi:hypothetical protein